MNATARWCSLPGSYLLFLTLAEPLVLDVAGLGRSTFPSGRYAYAGSALGPGGVAARVSRHLQPGKRTHWHVDYLTGATPITAIASAYGADRRECAWVASLLTLSGVTVPVPKFGNSDCRSHCPAHLVRLPDDLPLSWIENELTRCPIQTI